MVTFKNSLKKGPYSGIPKDSIIEELEKICSSDEFKSKIKICDFLRYIVSESLTGNEDQLKGYSIGLAVFGRNADFDPDHDPIVRIQAGRLRRSLKLYFLGEGKNDPVRIVIPKGGYKPLFLSQNEVEIENYVSGKVQDAHGFSTTGLPTIAVLPFSYISGDPEKEYFAKGMAEEISIELSRYDHIQVIGWRNSDEGGLDIEVLQRLNVYFVIDGSVQLSEQKLKVNIKLSDCHSNEQIWTEQYKFELSADNISVLQEEIAREAVVLIASEYGIIPHRISEESNRRQTDQPVTYDAMLRYYYYILQQTPESALNALNALEQAVKNDPGCGVILSMLAGMYGNQYMVDRPGAENAIEKMIKHAGKAVQIEPNNQFVRLIYAWTLFTQNKKEQFFSEMEKALELNPRSPFQIGAIGFFLCLYGKWKEGKILLDKAMKINYTVPEWYHGATTLYYYRNGDYKHALDEAEKYNTPLLFWGPLLRIACLGQLNRVKDSESNIKLLFQLKPDFSQKAKMLISRYVKEDDLVDHIIDGLKKAGLRELK